METVAVVEGNRNDPNSTHPPTPRDTAETPPLGALPAPLRRCLLMAYSGAKCSDGAQNRILIEAPSGGAVGGPEVRGVAAVSYSSVASKSRPRTRTYVCGHVRLWDLQKAHDSDNKQVFEDS